MSDPANDPADRVDELTAEVERLRALVGPSERSYTEMYEDLLAARDIAKGAEAATGQLRGEISWFAVALERAQQDQEQFQRMISDRTRSVFTRAKHSIRRRL